MSDAQPDSIAYSPPIPTDLVERYVQRFPHLKTLGAQIVPTERGRHAAKHFARAICALQTPTTVTLREVWNLAGVAEGKPWPPS